MSILGDVLNEIAQEVLPEVAAITFPDVMDILSETVSKDSRGAAIKSAATTEYADIPVSWKKNSDGRRVVVGDKPIAYGNYKLTFPMYKDGERIDLTAGMKLQVQERDLEPVKTFQIVEIFDNSGVTWEVEAKKES